MNKILRSLRKKLVLNKSYKKYILYAIGEILLVVIGILIALKINNLNNNKIQRNTESNIYSNLKIQINEDAQLIRGVIDYNMLYFEQFVYANQIIDNNDRSKLDTLVKIAPKMFKYSDFNRSGNIFQNLINSGDLKLLKNHNIVKGIQSLEEAYIYMNRLEENHFKVILEYGRFGIVDNINFSNGQIERPDHIYSFQFQNLLYAVMDISKEKDDIYNQALNEIDLIVNLIDAEIN